MIMEFHVLVGILITFQIVLIHGQVFQNCENSIYSTGHGPHGREIGYSPIVNGNYTYVAGDLIQYKNSSGKWSHTAIITGFRQESSTTAIPLVTYRSSPTSRDVDVEYDYYPGVTEYRIILLDGYYPN